MTAIARLFGINQNKTTELTLELFTPCYGYLCKQIEPLYQKTIEIQRKEDEYEGLWIEHQMFYREEEKFPEHIKGYLHIDESLEQEGYKLHDFLMKVRKDVRFIQMWLSLVVDPLNPTSTKEKLPLLLANTNPKYKKSTTDVYSIPPGKEVTWKKAEELIEFYLGLKLIL